MRNYSRWIVVPALALPLAARAPQEGPSEPTLPPKYAMRTEGRATLADRAAGDAILAGLEWLRDHQSKDGRWNSDEFMTSEEAGSEDPGPGNPVHDIGLTGLALLAFLADGHTTTRGDFAPTLERGLAWLRSQQQQGTGLFGTNSSNEFFYSHLVAALAMVEAFGLSGDAALRRPAQNAVRYVEWHRNPDRVWRYQPRDNDHDVSVTVWAMNLLITARDFGFDVDADALLAGDRYILEMTDTAAGRTGYTQMGGLSARRPGEHGERFPRESNETLTGAALLVEFLLECDPDARPGMSNQVERVMSRLPVWNPDAGAVDFYAYYHGSLAMRQAGDARWQRWSTALHDALVPSQREDGGFAGSWDPVGPWGEDGGRIYSTAMGVLSLSAHYRYAEIAAIVPLPDTATFRSAIRAWTDARFDAFAAMLDRIESTNEDEPETLAAIATARSALEQRIVRTIATVDALRGSEDYVAARDALTVIAKQFGKLEPGRMADAILDGFKKSKHVQDEIKAQESYDELVRRYDPSSGAQRRRLIGGLERLCERYAGTRGASRAEALLRTLR